jgi:hypothetical protein
MDMPLRLEELVGSTSLCIISRSNLYPGNQIPRGRAQEAGRLRDGETEDSFQAQESPHN